MKNSFEKPTRSELLVYNRFARVATRQQSLDAPAYCRCGANYRLWLVWSRGRSVYDNIRRFLQFQITVNVVALTLCSIGAITGVGTPLTAVQLIWVCPRTSHLPTSLPSSLSLSTAVRYKLLRVRPSS